MAPFRQKSKIVKIDLHVSTKPLTREALHDPIQALHAAQRRGLDGIAFTERNIVRGASAFMQLDDIARTRFGLTVFQGLLMDTTRGPLLVYGQSIAQTGESGVKVETLDMAAAIEFCKESGWAVVLASPFRVARDSSAGLCHRFTDYEDAVNRAHEEMGYLVRLVNAIEVSGAVSKRENSLALDLARAFNLPVVVGSGACYHTQIRAGCYTRFPNDVRTSEHLARAITTATPEGTDHGRFRPADPAGIYSSVKPDPVRDRSLTDPG